MESIRYVLLLLAAFVLLSLAFAVRAHEAHRSAEPAVATAAAPKTADGHQHGETAMGAQMDRESAPATFGGRLVRWLGRLHNAAVHFPIALLLVIAVLEVVAWRFNLPTLAVGNRVLMGVAAVSVVGAAALGWFAMGWSVGQEDAVHETHRFIGTSLIPLSLGAWWAREKLAADASRKAALAYGLLLGSAVLAVTVNGYLGGALSHGGMRHLMF